MENNIVQEFEIYLNWTVSILKTQDPQVINSFKQEASYRLSPEQLKDILIAALYQLAETEPEVFVWALHNYDPEFYIEVRYRIAVAAARQLIRQGLVPGTDFSAIPTAGLIVRPEAKAILQENTSAFTSFMLREILHTFKKN
ncbi:MAG TPA: hypothetical protein V6C65_37995 [Allocoleopsis sp.]